MKLKDIKFKCTKTGKKRVAELTIEGYKHKVQVYVSPRSCDQNFGVTLPVFGFDERTISSQKDLNELRTICKYIYSTYWIWLKEADVFFNKLVEDGLSVKKALDVIANNYNRSAEAANRDGYFEDFTDVIRNYWQDCSDNRFPVFQHIELPVTYSYEWKTSEELKKEKIFILI